MKTFQNTSMFDKTCLSVLGQSILDESEKVLSTPYSNSKQATIFIPSVNGRQLKFSFSFELNLNVI